MRLKAMIDISKLENNQTIRYRLGKHGEHSVKWSEWKIGKIYVAKFRGNIVTLTPVGESWAEYNPQRDYHGNGFFDCEEWCMEIDLKNGILRV